MILVTGATGSIGSRLLPLLVERGAPVRALAHSPGGRAVIEGLGVEAVDGDFDRPDTLERAMEGCDRVFLLSPPHPDLPTRERAAIDVARRSGVGSVVKLSTVGAHVESRCPFLVRHGEVEDHLRQSGLGWTLLRPGCFMHVHLLPVDMVRAGGTWYGMTGGGAHAYIDVGDIAAAAAAVLTSEGHDGQIYELSGPEAMTLAEAADQLSDVIGTRVAYVDLPADDYGASLAEAGLPAWVVEGIVSLYQMVREGHLATVTRSVEELTNRPPLSYADFARAHREAFLAA